MTASTGYFVNTGQFICSVCEKWLTAWVYECEGPESAKSLAGVCCNCRNTNLVSVVL
ncbi:hypothetical protein BABINDRAFT_159621 [Babjeviella inositovora NRRL Y-12698]|uniref:Uncharacterized protein n=1 Tax=Babjeviella inositovora NRRL Y-12698 TaxID=984486 RepID=A0A1E3QZS3_9ASCO|nr:uncharacterized protein BABINDRAFT_159621 [Babjeviella inositovora NRRL Y-12698]ODQ83180.1 hypothetical protein BABINDRAFT_159621 [Babjeviella inositovora NRRL Y-12698]